MPHLCDLETVLFETAALSPSAFPSSIDRVAHVSVVGMSPGESRMSMDVAADERITFDLHDLYDNAPCGYHSVGPDGTILRMVPSGPTL